MHYEAEGDRPLLARWGESVRSVLALRAVRVGTSAASIALLCTAAGYAFFSGPVERSSETIIPIIVAEETVVKERPKDPGGIRVPHRDAVVYDVIRSGDPDALRKADAVPDKAESVGDRGDGDRDLKEAAREATRGTAGKDGDETRRAPEVLALEDPEEGVRAPRTRAEGDRARDDRDRAEVGAPVDITRGPGPARPEAVAPAPGEGAGRRTGGDDKPAAAGPEAERRAAPGTARAPESGDGTRRYEAPPYVVPARGLATVDIMGPYRVQVGAYRSAEQAQRTWTALQARHRDVLQPLYLVIERVDLGPRGVLFRLQAGPLQSASDARTLCGILTDRRVGCILVRG